MIYLAAGKILTHDKLFAVLFLVMKMGVVICWAPKEIHNSAAFSTATFIALVAPKKNLFS